MITSLQNDHVKHWRKLHKRKERESSKSFIVEGFHLVEEACHSDWDVLEIIIQEHVDLPDFCHGYPVTRVSKQVFTYISQTRSPQGIAAKLKMKHAILSLNDKVLIVDAIQDPGNLGTIIRTADAAGFSSIILGDNTVDVYNDKVVRATQGSLFHVSMVYQNLNKAIPQLQEEGYTIWASTLKNAEVYHQIKPNKKTALIVGNEGAGIQDSLLDIVDTLVYIPIYGKAESLNVSVAAGVLMYYING